MFLMREGGHVPDEGREGTMFLMREGTMFLMREGKGTMFLMREGK